MDTLFAGIRQLQWIFCACTFPANVFHCLARILWSLPLPAKLPCCLGLATASLVPGLSLAQFEVLNTVGTDRSFLESRDPAWMEGRLRQLVSGWLGTGGGFSQGKSPVMEQPRGSRKED